MTGSFQDLISGGKSPGEKAKPDLLQDDPARSDSYVAFRRVRTFSFPDVWFIDHTGSGQAFQWAHVRRMVKDGKGTRLTLIWDEAEVSLSGRHLNNPRFEEDIQRRIVAEFYQITPGTADSVPPGVPVITTMRITSADADAGEAKPAGIFLVEKGE